MMEGLNIWLEGEMSHNLHEPLRRYVVWILEGERSSYGLNLNSFKYKRFLFTGAMRNKIQSASDSSPFAMLYLEYNLW